MPSLSRAMRTALILYLHIVNFGLNWSRTLHCRHRCANASLLATYYLCFSYLERFQCVCGIVCENFERERRDGARDSLEKNASRVVRALHRR
jgi:hypothetical protein